MEENQRHPMGDGEPQETTKQADSSGFAPWRVTPRFRRCFRFEGRFTELLPIALINLFLMLVTLGIYRFWARTRVRQYLWSRTRLLDDPFEYTGTGKELFIGFLFVFFLFLLPAGIFGYYLEILQLQGNDKLMLRLVTPFYLLFFYLWGVAIYRAERYRMSRTEWRGIRGAQAEKGWVYGFVHFGMLIANVSLLWLLVPLADMVKTEYIYNRRYFGGDVFRFEGKAGPIYRRYIACWLLFIPSLGLSLAWYKAKLYRHIANHLHYRELKFGMQVTGFEVLWLWVGNALIWIFTLSLGSAFISMRTLRFFANRLELQGNTDFSAIAQSAHDLPGQGEGLADALDVGGF